MPTTGPGYAIPDSETTLPAGYQTALPTEPMVFHTMMCQVISADVAADMFASTQANPHPSGGRVCQGGGGRGYMGCLGGDPEQVAFTGNCNRCSKVGHYVQYCPERNTYWDPPPDGTEDTTTKVHFNKGDKLDATIYY